MTTDNVVRIEAAQPLDRLAARIKGDLDRREQGREQWREATIDLCLALAEARRSHAGNQEFGQWCEAQDFKINHQDRAAAIAMAEQPDALRRCIEATERHSLQTIHKFDFARFTNVSKTPRPRKQKAAPKTAAVREALRPLVEAGEGINRAKLAEQLDVSATMIQLAEVQERARLEGIAEARAVPPVARDDMPVNMAARFDAAVRKARRELKAEITSEVHATYGLMLQGIREQLRQADQIIASQKGLMPRALFRKILACLHPDVCRRDDAADLLKEFLKLENVLVKPERVFSGPPVPATIAELLAQRRRPKTRRD